MMAAPEQPGSIDTRQGNVNGRHKLTQLFLWHRPEQELKEKIQSYCTISWPFKESLLHSHETSITASPDMKPGVIIETYASAPVRSPINATKVKIRPSNGQFSVILSVEKPEASVYISLEGLSEVFPHIKELQVNEPVDSDDTTAIHEGDLLGNLGRYPHNKLTLRISYRPRGPTRYFHRQHFIDPREVLPAVF